MTDDGVTSFTSARGQLWQVSIDADGAVTLLIDSVPVLEGNVPRQWLPLQVAPITVNLAVQPYLLPDDEPAQLVEPAAPLAIEATAAAVNERQHYCEAYGPGAGPRACFFEQNRPCTTDAECASRMAGERDRLFLRIGELAAAGDETGIYLAGQFASPDELLGGTPEQAVPIDELISKREVCATIDGMPYQDGEPVTAVLDRLVVAVAIMPPAAPGVRPDLTPGKGGQVAPDPGV